MSDPSDPTQAGGVPTPPEGSPSVVGTGAGAPVPPDAPPTVASPSVYSEPPVTAHGPEAGGPGGPVGPDGDEWGPDGPEPPDDRWRIYLLVGLAVVVIALLIGGIILSQSDDGDGEGDTTTTSSPTTSSSSTTTSTSTSTTSTSTTTTTAPTTTTAAPTTTTAAGPPGAASPEAAAASLYDAWTAGDQANAGQFADPGAVTTLFAQDGVGNDLSFQGCDPGGGGFDCSYTDDSEIVLFTVDPVPRGYRVTAVSFPND